MMLIFGRGKPCHYNVGYCWGYKSLVANGCLEIYNTKNVTMGKLLQRNYYEHIKRDEQSYHIISNYVKNNPVKWTIAKYNKNQILIHHILRAITLRQFQLY